VIAAATAAQLPVLHALIERAYRGEAAKAGWTHEADLLGGQRTDLLALQEMLADPDQRLLGVHEGDTLVGCVLVRRCAAGRCSLGLLTVEPMRQAAGLGRRLIAAAEAAARDMGATAMEMTVIERRGELVRWYERRGYRLTGERRPFPLDDPRFGLPKTRDLDFVVLERTL
jgi:GNAT superfamily N-acetyltransferase